MGNSISIPVAHLRESSIPNPNKMPPDQFEKLQAAIKLYGFEQPVLVRPLHRIEVDADGNTFDAYEIVDGVHRKQAAEALGMKEIPCVVNNKITDAQARALRISMNRLRGDLDLGLVASDFKALADLGWDSDALASTGFSLDEVNALMSIEGANGDFEMPEDIGAEPDEPDNRTEWVLELVFTNKVDLQKCKRRLRRIAGRGGELSSALLKVLAEEKEE